MIRRRQQHQPVALGLTVTQRSDVLRLLRLWTRHLRRISNHKRRFFSIHAQQDFPGIIDFQKSLDTFVVCYFVSCHRTGNFAQTWRSGFQYSGYDPGSFPSNSPVIEKILHKWQKLGKLVHGNLLFLDLVVSLFQYRGFPILCPNSCPKVRESSPAPLGESRSHPKCNAHVRFPRSIRFHTRLGFSKPACVFPQRLSRSDCDGFWLPGHLGD